MKLLLIRGQIPWAIDSSSKAKRNKDERLRSKLVETYFFNTEASFNTKERLKKRPARTYQRLQTMMNGFSMERLLG
jgi:rRNA pseudouridine-1189 N-methylase Emg1 (Nep1/Mra1 family)